MSPPIAPTADPQSSEPVTSPLKATGSLQLLPGRALLLPLGFALGLLAFALSPSIRQSPRVSWSLLGPGVALVAWCLVLLVSAVRTRRVFGLEVVLRKQHYVQACAHTSIFLYWGWYWPPVYQFAHLIVAQLLFAYAFDILLSYSRRNTYALGFGPFPIIFSTNLFLWFKQDWFYLQILMIAVGFSAKEFIRWTKDGRQTHIFNPSSFTLTLFSVALLFTGSSDMTWGKDIAITQFYPPHMYVFLFLIALPGQFFFGVTTMTMSAVLTTYVCGLFYYGVTGTYYFFDSYIPIAVFLGMHLLFTDPSTAPRTELGRMIFGALYGLTTIALYEVLGVAGLPTFYDKLLQVPVLNLMIKGIDRAARSRLLERVDPSRVALWLFPGRRNLGYVSIWAAAFVALVAGQGVGDSHRGQWLPFWQQACAQDRRFACQYLAQLHSTYCGAGAGWSCNELGVLQADRDGDRPEAYGSMRRGCELGFQPACVNATALVDGAPRPAGASEPPLADLPILLRGSKGPIAGRGSASLYARACVQGWPGMCGRVAQLDH